MDESVWSNGGMLLTGLNWSTGRKTLYSVGGRWMNEYGAMVEWYWQGKTEVLAEKHYTAWVVDEWMSMEQWWNEDNRIMQNYYEKNLFHCHFVYQKSYTDRTRDRLLTSEPLLALTLFYMSKVMSFHFRNCDVFRNTISITCNTNLTVSLSFALRGSWYSLLTLNHLISCLSRLIRVLRSFKLNDSHYICDRTKLDYSDLDPPKGEVWRGKLFVR